MTYLNVLDVRLYGLEQNTDREATLWWSFSASLLGPVLSCVTLVRLSSSYFELLLDQDQERVHSSWIPMYKGISEKSLHAPRHVTMARILAVDLR